MNPELIDCPCCGSNACSKNPTSDGINVYLCWTCGFTTNDELVEGSDFEKENFEKTAELIKDLKQVHDGLSWYPKVLNLPDKGMIFPEWNRRVKDWYWAAVQAISMTEDEKEKYPNPMEPGEFYGFKMDIANIKHYDKMCFMDAAEKIGLFDPS